MGYHILPSYKCYWNTATDLHVPLITNSLSRDRFQQILSFIHINDNLAIPNNNTDKLYKLRPFLQELNKQFSQSYNGTRELSVDESMILYKTILSHEADKTWI